MTSKPPVVLIGGPSDGVECRGDYWEPVIAAYDHRDNTHHAYESATGRYLGMVPGWVNWADLEQVRSNAVSGEGASL